MKKLVTLLIGICLVLSMVPALALAAPSAPSIIDHYDSVYANGTPVTIEENSGSTIISFSDSGSTVYLKADGTTTSNVSEAGDFTDFNIYGGSYAAAVDSTSITMKGGKVASISGGGESSGGTVTGNVAILVSGGTVDTVYGVSAGCHADTVSVKVEGGTVSNVVGIGHQSAANFAEIETAAAPPSSVAETDGSGFGLVCNNGDYLLQGPEDFSVTFDLPKDIVLDTGKTFTSTGNAELWIGNGMTLDLSKGSFTKGEFVAVFVSSEASFIPPSNMYAVVTNGELTDLFPLGTPYDVPTYDASREGVEEFHTVTDSDGNEISLTVDGEFNPTESGTYFIVHEFAEFDLKIELNGGAFVMPNSWIEDGNTQREWEGYIDWITSGIIDSSLVGSEIQHVIPSPVKDGYTFLGWYLDEELTQPAVTFEAKDTTLYAKWATTTSGASGAEAAPQPEPNNTIAATGDTTTVAFLGTGVLTLIALLIFTMARRRAHER